MTYNSFFLTLYDFIKCVRIIIQGGLCMNNVDDLYNNIWKKIEAFKEKYGNKATINNFEQDILDSKNPWLCCWFARDIEGSNKKALEQVVIDGKEPRLCYEFAKWVEGADIKALEQAVIESKCSLVFLVCL